MSIWKFLYSILSSLATLQVCLCISIADVEQAVEKIDFSDADDDKVLYLYTGIDYIPYEIIKLFEKKAKLHVITSIFDSNETLEAKMLAGGAMYDIVFPTAFPNFHRQLLASIYQKINMENIGLPVFDAYVQSKLPSNEYCIPYQWGISGIGINLKLAKKALPNVALDSYAIVFEEKYVKHLAKYGVSLSDSHDEVFPEVAAYLGKSLESLNHTDIKQIASKLNKIRKYIKKFTQYGFEDLSSENACVVFGTSGDIYNVKKQQENTTREQTIIFVAPKEGVALWVDVAAIPRAAKHVKNAHLFLKFITQPTVAAYIANSTCRATAVVEALRFVDDELKNNIHIFPDETIKRKCYIEKYQHGSLSRERAHEFTKIKSNLSKR